MRILFYDPNHADYNVGSVFERPMGGTQSAACYLAMELARLGHEVLYLTGAAGLTDSHGVTCLGRQYLNFSGVRDLAPDVLIIIQKAGQAAAMRGHLPGHCRVIFWTADTAYQPVVAALKDAGEQAAIDDIVTVSDWQRRQFAAAFPAIAEKLHTLRYGISPAFYDAISDGEAILPAKSWPPILAYTSTPFRGLSVLLHAFPAIRAAVPEVTLRIFSGMKVYFIDPLLDTAENRALYKRAREMPGVSYVGNLAQPALAAEMRTVSVLAYPNTYEETACLSVMEALAAGCAVVSTALGALPETTAGLATLIPPTPAENYVAAFTSAVIDTLRRQRSEPAAEEAARRRGVAYGHAQWRWSDRAADWHAFLTNSAAQGSAVHGKVPPSA